MDKISLDQEKQKCFAWFFNCKDKKGKEKMISRYESRLIVHENIETTKVANSQAASQFCREILHMHELPQEHFYALYFNAKMEIFGYELVSKGSIETTFADPRDIFRSAILANAYAIIAAHNHPSGDTTPSECDVAVTRRLCEAGNILGVKVLDHVIIGEGYYSFGEHNQLGTEGKENEEV